MKTIHHHLCRKSPLYHRWHQHPLHKHVHWGLLGAVVMGVALSFVMLGWSGFGNFYGKHTPQAQAQVISQSDIDTVTQRLNAEATDCGTVGSRVSSILSTPVGQDWSGDNPVEWERAGWLVRAYGCGQGSSAVHDRLVAALDFAELRTPFDNCNWATFNCWWVDQGIPQQLGPPMLFGGNSVVSDVKPRMDADYTRFYGKLRQSESGTDAIWAAFNNIYGALYFKDQGRLYTVINLAEKSTIKVPYNGQIREDWSYFYHWDKVNNQYGANNARETAHYLSITRGTGLDIAKGAKDGFYEWFKHWIQWVTYKGYYDPLTSSKHPYWNGGYAMKSGAETLITLDDPQYRSYQPALVNIRDLSDAPLGAMSYPLDSYLAARRPGWFAGIKLISLADPPYEASSFNTMLGAVDVLTPVNLTEKLAGGWNDSNAELILHPYQVLGLVTLNAGMEGQLYSIGNKNFVAGNPPLNQWGWYGVSTLGGYYAIAAQSFNWGLTGGNLNLQKAWFVFDDEILSTQTGNTSDPAGAQTWLLAFKANSSNADSSSGSRSLPTTSGGTIDFGNPSWIATNNIGYAFLKNERVKAKAIEDGYVRIYADHGSGFNSAVALLPGKDSGFMSGYSGNSVDILQLDANAHVVKDRTSGALGAAVFTSVNHSEVSLDKPGYLMYKENGSEFRLSLFNPEIANPADLTNANLGNSFNPKYDVSVSNPASTNYTITIPQTLTKSSLCTGCDLFSVRQTASTVITVNLRANRKFEIKAVNGEIVEATIGMNDPTAGTSATQLCTPNLYCTTSQNCQGTCASDGSACNDNPGDTCPSTGPTCGLNGCEAGETAASCPQDCGSTQNQPPRNLVLRYLGPTPTGGNLCGNPPGRIDPGEQCDGSNLNGQTCQTRGFSGSGLTCSADCKSFNTSQCEPPSTGQVDYNPPFPRIGVIYFYEANIPEEIWKNKDLVVTRYWYPQVAEKIKGRFPDKIVLAANNIIDGVGIFSPMTPPNPHPADPWLVPLVGGTTPYPVGTPYCVNGWHMGRHPGNCLYDGTNNAPTLSAYGNARWNQYLPDYLAQGTDWSIFDGTFWDSWAGGVYSNADKVDFDRNGVADGEPSANRRWLEGNRLIVENMRDASPVGKGVQVAHESDASEYQYLNGRGFEYWKGYNWQWVFDNILTPYAQSAVPPRINFIEGQGNPDNFSRMRFGLTTAALVDAYFYFEQEGTQHLSDYHYDEFIGDLGFPTGPATAIRPGVYVRYFDKGAVITNGSGSPQTVLSSNLTGGPFYRFRGGQDPNFNNGQQFTSVSLAGSGAPNSLGSQTGDGIMLFRQPTTLVTDIIVDNVARNMTSPGSNPVTFIGSWVQQDMGTVSNTVGYALHYGWDQYGAPYAKATQQGATASYKPTIGVSGSYEIWEWHPNISNVNGGDNQGTPCNAVPVTVSEMTCTEFPASINQSVNPGQWNRIGTCAMTFGTVGSVTLVASNGCTTVADAVKFVYRGQ